MPRRLGSPGKHQVVSCQPRSSPGPLPIHVACPTGLQQTPQRAGPSGQALSLHT